MLSLPTLERYLKNQLPLKSTAQDIDTVSFKGQADPSSVRLLSRCAFRTPTDVSAVSSSPEGVIPNSPVFLPLTLMQLINLCSHCWVGSRNWTGWKLTLILFIFSTLSFFLQLKCTAAWAAGAVPAWLGGQEDHPHPPAATLRSAYGACSSMCSIWTCPMALFRFSIFCVRNSLLLHSVLVFTSFCSFVCFWWLEKCLKIKQEEGRSYRSFSAKQNQYLRLWMGQVYSMTDICKTGRAEWASGHSQPGKPQAQAVSECDKTSNYGWG